MTRLRHRMIEARQLRALAPRTQEAYVGAVQQLAQHEGTSPDLLTEADLRPEFRSWCNEQHAARTTCPHAVCGITFWLSRTCRGSSSI